MREVYAAKNADILSFYLDASRDYGCNGIAPYYPILYYPLTLVHWLEHNTEAKQ